MTIIIDVKPSGIESGYEQRPFDVAKTLLEGAGYSIISLKQFVDLRIAQGKESPVANRGAYASEAFVYDKDKGIFLVRKSPIMANAIEATNCHRNNGEFYLTPLQVEEALGKEGIDSVKFENGKPIPFNRFGEDKRTVFAFGSSAQPYGAFLQEAFKGIPLFEMPIYLANVEQKPFVRQVWLHRLDSDDRSELDGNNRNLDYNGTVRGVKVTSADEGSASVARKIITIEDLLNETAQTSAYAPDQIKNLQNILEQRGYIITLK